MVSTSVDLKRLALFRQVVESGGLSAAETVLNVNLPTISAHLASLEASLGMRLCERGRRGFRLTEQGQGVLAASERLFESVQAFRAELDAVGEKLREEWMAKAGADAREILDQYYRITGRTK